MASAIIVAAGSGLRMKNKTRKQYLLLSGLPILTRTLLVFAAHPQITSIFLVVPKDDFDYCRQIILPSLGEEAVSLVPGGAERQDSVYQGLKAASQSDIVLIHDGVRPFVTPAMITACIDAAARYGGCIPAIPVSDTLKRVGADRTIEKTLSRDGIWMAQTPQAFKRDLICGAYEHAFHTGAVFTDDAAVVEHYGQPVRIIEGSPLNIKITTPADLAFARALLAAGISGSVW